MRCDLSKTEMEIMQVLWDYGGQMSPGEILDWFNSRGKGWKRQTLNTLLKRMEDKEVIIRQRGSVHACCSKMEYRHLQSRQVVNESFGGRLDHFVTAFIGKEDITKEEARELKQLIKRLMQGKEEN